MQIVVYNDNDIPVQFKEDSMYIRAAYLLGEKVALAGNYFNRLDKRRKGIFVRQTMASVPLNNKIKIIRKYFKTTGQPLNMDLDDVKKQAENFAKIKNKTREYIVTYKRYEHAFNVIYFKIIEWYEEQIERSGYYELAKLLNEEAVKCFSVNFFNPEHPARNEFKPSNIISLNFEPLDTSKIFSLTNYFLKSPFADSFKRVTANHEDAKLEHIVYLEPLIKIADLNKLKASELTFMRKSLENIKQQLCKKADEWINMCYSSKPFEERKLILQHEVLPIANQMSELINSSPYMEHVQLVADKDQTLEIFIGEIPFHLLLDYHSHYDIIKKETLMQIKILQKNDDRFKKRWPVILFKLAAEDKADHENFSNNELFKSAVKKSISID